MKTLLKTVCVASFAMLAAVSANAQNAFITLGPWTRTPIEKPEGQWMTIEKYCEPMLTANNLSQFRSRSNYNLPEGTYELSFDCWFEKPVLTNPDLGREEFYFEAGANSNPLWQQRYGMPPVWSRVSNTFTVTASSTGAPYNCNFGFVVQVWANRAQPSHYRYHIDNFCVSNLVTGAVIFQDDFEQDIEGQQPTKWMPRPPGTAQQHADVWTITREFRQNTIFMLR